ncbi:MAG: serine/threonine protein kinase [Planctomycetales bacterium]|nr:serine/threonine protein kinase [Planctomycetales bacterium]
MTETDPFLGRVIGGCRVRRLVGRGGMGAVYEGDHLRLEKPVAVKVLPKALALEPGRAQRFLREARAAAKLEHPRIVPVYDTGEEADLYFITMRYVAGESAGRRVERTGPLAPREALRIVRGVAEALDAAHRRGIVHRDVKPENVLLDESDEPLLADFGLARDLASGSQLSASGQILGTPAYMSPEQARGESVDARSDLYSLGATLYFLVTGSPPFEAESALGTALKHILEDPIPPSERVSTVPWALEELIGRWMAKAPGGRPATATEALAEVDRLARGGFDTPRPRRRLPKPLVAGVAAAVATAAIGVGTLATLAGGAHAPDPTAPPAAPAPPGPPSPAAAPARAADPATLEASLRARAEAFVSVLRTGDAGRVHTLAPPSTRLEELGMARAFVRLAHESYEILDHALSPVEPIEKGDTGEARATLSIRARNRFRPGAAEVRLEVPFVRAEGEWWPKLDGRGGKDRLVREMAQLWVDRLAAALTSRDQPRIRSAIGSEERKGLGLALLASIPVLAEMGRASRVEGEVLEAAAERGRGLHARIRFRFVPSGEEKPRTREVNWRLVLEGDDFVLVQAERDRPGAGDAKKDERKMR